MTKSGLVILDDIRDWFTLLMRYTNWHKSIHTRQILTVHLNRGYPGQANLELIVKVTVMQWHIIQWLTTLQDQALGGRRFYFKSQALRAGAQKETSTGTQGSLKPSLNLGAISIIFIPEFYENAHEIRVSIG